MQYSQEHLKTMVYAKFGGQTECIMGNWKIKNYQKNYGNLGGFYPMTPSSTFKIIQMILSHIQ